MWFKNKSDEGIIHPEFSDGGLLSMTTISLVLTVVSPERILVDQLSYSHHTLLDWVLSWRVADRWTRGCSLLSFSLSGQVQCSRRPTQWLCCKDQGWRHCGPASEPFLQDSTVQFSLWSITVCYWCNGSRKHAKVVDEAPGSTENSMVDDADVEAAKKEWEDLELSEEDTA